METSSPPSIRWSTTGRSNGWNCFAGRPVKQVLGKEMERRWRLIAAAWIWVLNLAGAMAAEKTVSPVPPPELVGRWRGQGRIVSDWTSVQILPLDIGILPDGTVIGIVGHAEIAGGIYEEPKKRSPKKPQFILSVNLDGELLGDGVMRRAFLLSLNSTNGRLTGTAASDGVWLWPGAWRADKRRSKPLQVRSVSLSRVAARSP